MCLPLSVALAVKTLGQLYPIQVFWFVFFSVLSTAPSPTKHEGVQELEDICHRRQGGSHLVLTQGRGQEGNQGMKQDSGNPLGVLGSEESKAVPWEGFCEDSLTPLRVS